MSTEEREGIGAGVKDKDSDLNMRLKGEIRFWKGCKFAGASSFSVTCHH